MNTRETNRDIPDWKLDRFRLGELDAAESERIRMALESDAPLKKRIEALERADRETLERYPAGWMADRIREKVEAGGAGGRARQATRLRAGNVGRRRIWLWAAPVVPVAAVAVLLLVILPARQTPEVDPAHRTAPAVDTRIKGLTPQLLLYRKTASGSEQLADGAGAKEHDLILIRYEAAGEAYGVILSVDGRGTITRHFPAQGGPAGRLQAEGAVSLGFSYELDDAPRWEKFYFVTSKSPFDVGPVAGAVSRSINRGAGARGDSLDLPGSLRQSIFTLQKESRHG